MLIGGREEYPGSDPCALDIRRLLLLPRGEFPGSVKVGSDKSVSLMCNQNLKVRSTGKFIQF